MKSHSQKIEAVREFVDRLRFLVEDGRAHLQRELEISVKAGELVGQLYKVSLHRSSRQDIPQ